MSMHVSLTLRAASGTLALIVAAAGTPAVAQEHQGSGWSYEGDTGPEHWAELDIAYAPCGSGTEQSPIDIAAGVTARLDDMPSDYLPSGLIVVNNGHAIQVDYGAGSSIEIDGTAYELQQFHFHSPSEHTVDGELAAMELHLVHSDVEGAIAVVGVFLVEGDDNPHLDPIWDVMPAVAGDPIAIEGATIDADDLLPQDRRFIEYSGSLTTPPCTEGVTWHVLVEPVQLSAEQVSTFRAIHDGTNRPVQPLNDRSLE